MLDPLEHRPLIVCMLDLLELDNLGLLEDFDSVESLVVYRLNEMNSAETARPQRAVDGKVAEGVFALQLALRGSN